MQRKVVGDRMWRMAAKDQIAAQVRPETKIALDSLWGACEIKYRDGVYLASK